MAPIAAALLLPLAVSASSVPLSRTTQTMEDAALGEETYRHEKGVSPDDAGAIAEYLRHVGESRPEIVRVPGRAGIFLASDFCGATGESLGRCLILLQSGRGGVRELSRSGGVGEAYGLRPVVFAGGGRVVVLAELATEYSRGLRVYEIAGSSIRPLGAIDAGVPGELGEGDPTPYAKVWLENGQLVVRFDRDLVVGTGKEGAPVAKKPVVFRQREDGFVLEAPKRARRGR